jgi:hypothetical protein
MPSSMVLLVVCLLSTTIQGFIVTKSLPHAARPAARSISPPPALLITAKHNTARVSPMRMEAEGEVFWNGQRLHDYWNLGTIPVLIALSIAGIRAPAWNALLGQFMFTYITLDALWIAIQPHIVGSPKTLLGHHLATMLIVAHALTNPLHTRFISWMTVVEINTFFLILKRHVQHPILELAFKASWAAIRVIWFPVVAVYFTFTLGGWGAGWLNLARRVSVSGCVCGLALLQLQWTWNAMVAPLLKRSSESPEEDADGGDDDKKKGFL